MRHSCFCKILRCSKGVTIIEHALALPVFLLIAFGILEYSFVMYASAVIEGSTNEATRLAKTGYNNTSTTGLCPSLPPPAPTQSRTQFITCMVGNGVNGFLDPKNLVISSKYYAAYNNINQPEPYVDAAHVGHYVPGDPYTDVNGNGKWDADMGTAGLGGPGDIVVYTVSYPWHIFTPIMQTFLGKNGTLSISSSAIVKNEDFPSSR